MTSSAVEEALSHLTGLQREAVEWGKGAMLILAGPGSGKTRVLTSRIARILSSSEGQSFRILALTFTNKAADEMATRVAALVPGEERRATIGTFHSFCMRPDFAIYGLDADRQELLKEALRRAIDLDVDDVRYLSVIDKLKARLIPPEEAAQKFKDASLGLHVSRVYKLYEDELARNNALDFGSLIAAAFKLISTFQGVALSYRRTYTYWMIDEFQDTTDAQCRLIKALAGDKFSNVMAVADDDQIIYQWNGASFKQIQKFRADFKPKLLQLPTNYRCPPVIVEAANRLVLHNSERTATKLPLEAGKTTLQYPVDRHLRVRHFRDENEEAKGIALEIAGLKKTLWSEVVVLARTRALLEKTKSALSDANVLASISQRRDEFRSPQFQWLYASIRQAARPMDRRNFQTVVSAFNKWFGLEIRHEQIISEAEGSSRSYLEEWALAVVSEGEIPEVTNVGTLALTLAREPSRFRQFVEQVTDLFTADEEFAVDLSEDMAAWHDLERSIGQTIGRDAPLEQFLQELAIRSKEPPAPTGSVTLMTIHGSKGKEFDHVYLIGLAEDVLPSFQSLKAGSESAEMEEERRNCFVAITRTRECLCLSWADRYRGYSKQPSRFLSEMELPLPPTNP
jgi:DNA helicase-2/ATP-dependent DNA helicase PcrA